MQEYMCDKYGFKSRIFGPARNMFMKYLKRELMKGNNVDISYFGIFYFKDAYVKKIKYKKLYFKFHNEAYNLINNLIDFTTRGGSIKDK